MASRLKVDFADRGKLSMLGPNWSMRLNEWDKIPHGPCLLNAVVEDDDKQTNVQLICLIDIDGCLHYEGEWQLAPQLISLSLNGQVSLQVGAE